MKIYVVTLKKKCDIDSFYDDMETIGGSQYIPNRKVHCEKRRPISRNTNYFLTEEEALELKNDIRVLDVQLRVKERNIIIRPSYVQYSDSWDKSWTTDPNDVNWGLKRCINGHEEGWGSDATISSTDEIELTSTGKNVDVIIVDGHFNPDHPEMAKNSDGSGGSRANMINWYEYANSDNGTGEDIGLVYDYEPTNIYGENHGQHVSGTVAGNTQGWAKDANVYNISPFRNDPNMEDDEVFDYIREFHNNKPINPETGRRNPTITNNSWSYSYYAAVTDVVQVFFRGVLHEGPFTEGEITNFGINIKDGNCILPADVSSIDADIEDAIEDGIIVVGSAGNENMKLSIENDIDYNNYMIEDYFGTIYDYYYNRPPTPCRAANFICVGATSNEEAEPKAYYSSCGPRVDIYAPGTAIQSSLKIYENGSSLDSRGNGYIGKYQGTSMASPQVCGVLACLMEQIPSLTQEQALKYLIQYSYKDELYNSGTDNNDSDEYSLQRSANIHLKYIRLRPLTGTSYPRNTIIPRPISGPVYPRKRITYK